MRFISQFTLKKIKIVTLNSFQGLTDVKCSTKLQDSKMLNTDDNNGATELSLQHDMAYRL